MSRWVRARVTSDIGEWDQQVVGVTVRTPGYQPGDEVVVMPAGDADEMLQTLHNIRTSLRHHWAINVPGLDDMLARLAPHPPGGREP